MSQLGVQGNVNDSHRSVQDGKSAALSINPNPAPLLERVSVPTLLFIHADLCRNTHTSVHSHAH